MISINARQLILDFEVGGGERYYNRHLKKPVLPGAASGVTIGIGYDFGYKTRAQFLEDWGKRRGAARGMLPKVRGYSIDYADALQVYEQVTIPRFWLQTSNTFPGLTELPRDAQGALVSLGLRPRPGTARALKKRIS